jgi:hypothetical protein
MLPKIKRGVGGNHGQVSAFPKDTAVPAAPSSNISKNIKVMECQLLMRHELEMTYHLITTLSPSENN